MSLNSILFLVFFIIVLAVYWTIKNTKVRNIVLVIASSIFYAKVDIRLLILLYLIVTVIYLSGKKIDEIQDEQKKKKIVGLTVAFLIVNLGIFKYFNFFISSFTTLFNIQNTYTLSILLPLGVSFYTFQAISYVVDIYRKRIGASNNILDVGLFILFFPTISSGPINKAFKFMPQINKNKEFSWNLMSAGMQIFVIGLFKKMVVADRLGIFVDNVYAKPLAFNSATVILAIISYSIQLYADFSGYSDMAIGIAKMLGYEVPKNFNAPYLSKNISEFWKRWHISFSDWLMDYLYIPLGGSRKGKARTRINLILIMLIGGLWHGANWTFVAWGALHGIGLVVQKAFSEKYTVNNNHSKIGQVISVIMNISR